ncbi:hypothetical protein BDQ94DRAFT_65430 [Aspergillus welwitschiae]|uniref:Uncharacterized protein n=1 Tax=Aspergillus welwitschiae TaxID=1341132 RepID=A0A3F3PVE9_9EURO|nr:hypothetical protein BDQ94DRAFT_65430 [Aspergillus welwitschiae]RDH30907.1 hypothetical protein BDQ94DRAFT_65430 [Aspergillus welwitschiae]
MCGQGGRKIVRRPQCPLYNACLAGKFVCGLLYSVPLSLSPIPGLPVPDPTSSTPQVPRVSDNEVLSFSSGTKRGCINVYQVCFIMGLCE